MRGHYGTKAGSVDKERAGVACSSPYAGPLAGHKWISAQLEMGCSSNLTAHINRIKWASERAALRIQRKREKG